jgi:heptosyltransferase I
LDALFAVYGELFAMKKNSQKLNLLIIKPSSLGDIIHGLQIVAGIKAQRPNAAITWVVRDTFRGWVENCPLVDKVILFNRSEGFASFRKLISEIRKQHFDYVLDLQGLARSGIMTFLSRADCKIGRSDSRELAWLSYNETAPFPKPGKMVHIVDVLLEFLPLLGLKREIAPVSFLPVGKVKIPAGAVILCPYARGAAKEWPYMVELTRGLVSNNIPVVWIGQGNPMTGSLAESALFINLINQTRLEEVPEILKQAKLLVSPDTGIMHLAVALGLPSLVLFGKASDPRYTGPYEKDLAKARVLMARDGNLDHLLPESVLKSCLNFLDFLG